MARIASSELERIKQDISLVRLVEMEGFKLRRQGRDFVLQCPFHNEKTPSLVVSPHKNLFHCFGCNESGSVIDWVMKTQSLTVGRAIGYLKTLSGVERTNDIAAVSVASRALSGRGDISNIDDDGQSLLSQTVDFYHQQLLDSVEAKQWLIRRGLTHPELVNHFKLGYAGRSGIAQALPSKSSKDGKSLRERLSAIGVLRSTTNQDHFRGCFIVPVMGFNESVNPAQRGKVLQLYGRRTLADYKIAKGSAKYLYLPSPLVGVWNESCLVSSSEVILCEALIDAMTLWCLGWRNVISSYGVNGFTADHLRALEYHGIKKVFIAYDRDEVGDKAADKLGLELNERGISCYRVILPKGMDINEYALKHEQPESALALVLEQAQLIGDKTCNKNNEFKKEPKTQENAELNPISTLSTATTTVTANPLLADIPCQLLDSGELLIEFGSRLWRVRGWQKNHSGEVMKINLQVVDNETGLLFVDSLDMYSAKQRNSYIKLASEELCCDDSLIKKDIGRILLKLEQLQDESLRSAVEVESVKLSDEQQQAALLLLKSPDLTTRIIDDLASCGVVGESTNLLAGYLAAVSRKLDKPLAVLIQSSSSAGKSSLMDAVLNLIPEEERVQYSAMTGQSLFYLGETNLQHKILAIAEEEGVRQAAYALKLLQSDGELTIASTAKDENSGDLVTREYKVKGPVMLMLTTTAIDVDEELLNRCLVLSVNESREQTQAIHALQRYNQTLEGLLANNEKAYITELHHNAQRLLKPIHVVNPYANQLTFLSDKTRTRRDHVKYLTLIQSITLLHQYQRPIKTAEHRGESLEYIEVTLDDIKLANELAHDILGRTLDELPPQTRKLLILIREMAAKQANVQKLTLSDVRFTRRDIREYTQWSDSQLKNHCFRLVEMEYLLVRGGCRGHLMQYELLWNGEDNTQSYLNGLLDVNQLFKLEQSTKKQSGNECKSG